MSTAYDMELVDVKVGELHEVIWRLLESHETELASGAELSLRRLQDACTEYQIGTALNAVRFQS